MVKKAFAVKISGVSKKYILHHDKPTLMESIFKHRHPEIYWALKNINFSIYPGDKLGIIGPNGSGKTTLLKIISGIAIPTSGSIKTQGKLVSLIGLSAGFHPELTGYENIFLNGMIIGMSKAEIQSKITQIINFADIGAFIDAPFYTYSTGMQLRIGFSVAIHSDPDIIVLDEGLSAGDEAFRLKCYLKIQELFKQNKTIIIASHQLDFISKHCNQAIYLSKGHLFRYGKPSQVIATYLHHR